MWDERGSRWYPLGRLLRRLSRVSQATFLCELLRAREQAPEAAADGPISRLRDGDIIRLDARAGVLDVRLDTATLAARTPVKPEVFDTTYGVGRELFTRLREGATPADEGASIL